MTPTGILETALYAEDLDAAEAFYHDVLGLERLSRVGDRHVFFRCGDGVLLIFNPAETATPPAPDAKLPVPPHGMRGEGHVCFRATEEEIDRWKQHLAEHGVAIESEFEWPKGGRSIYFRDPSGNSIEFANPKIWGL
ncbi:glyoxalase/bleomycin resistance/extradiol dioxygenase family protein [Chelativorans sp. ZYF759]|uniref:VOC family protein n=1 Tax=Chelativorans sp. ZYF759 TaxID=2692213 RepID=UPI00145E6E7E|nr:VOC family protein [Chelativorans sp. ZYF759]NMG40879.1 glyoxalase/bleomycin resistance/extradiol dioxygenase family protein [Chelativorans sp. ZYF759]